MGAYSNKTVFKFIQLFIQYLFIHIFESRRKLFNSSAIPFIFQVLFFKESSQNSNDIHF